MEEHPKNLTRNEALALVAAQRTEIFAKDAALTKVGAELSAKNAALTEVGAELSAKNAALTEVGAELSAKGAALTEIGAELSAKIEESRGALEEIGDSAEELDVRGLRRRR